MNSRLTTCSLVSYGADYNDIIEELKKSERLEVDEENECIRLKENWEVVRIMRSLILQFYALSRSLCDDF